MTITELRRIEEIEARLAALEKPQPQAVAAKPATTGPRWPHPTPGAIWTGTANGRDYWMSKDRTEYDWTSEGMRNVGWLDMEYDPSFPSYEEALQFAHRWLAAHPQPACAECQRLRVERDDLRRQLAEAHQSTFPEMWTRIVDGERQLAEARETITRMRSEDQWQAEVKRQVAEATTLEAHIEAVRKVVKSAGFACVVLGSTGGRFEPTGKWFLDAAEAAAILGEAKP